MRGSIALDGEVDDGSEARADVSFCTYTTSSMAACQPMLVLGEEDT
jgi:hypothetical protein